MSGDPYLNAAVRATVIRRATAVRHHQDAAADLAREAAAAALEVTALHRTLAKRDQRITDLEADLARARRSI